MPSILGANEIKATGYDVANSVRFNSADSPTLKDSAGDAAPAGNRKKFTCNDVVNFLNLNSKVRKLNKMVKRNKIPLKIWYIKIICKLWMLS